MWGVTPSSISFLPTPAHPAFGAHLTDLTSHPWSLKCGWLLWLSETPEIADCFKARLLLSVWKWIHPCSKPQKLNLRLFLKSEHFVRFSSQKSLWAVLGEKLSLWTVRQLTRSHNFSGHFFVRWLLLLKFNVTCLHTNQYTLLLFINFWLLDHSNTNCPTYLMVK